ncbi:MAG: SpoIIE family protein phosphatase, partial [Candidatus Eisenbacteria bacterium]
MSRNLPVTPKETARTIAGLAERLNSAPSFEQLMTTILLTSREGFRSHASAVFLPDKQRSAVSAFVSPGDNDAAYLTGKLPAGQGFLASASGAPEPVRAGRTTLADASNSDLAALLKIELQSALAIPLRGGDGPVGTLCVFNSQNTEGFSDEDVRLAETFAAPVSLGVRLFHFKNELRKSFLEWDMLYEVGSAVGSSLDTRGVLNSILDALRNVLKYDAAGIVLVGPGASEINYLVTRGYTPEFVERVRLKVGQGLVGWAIKHKTGAIVPDTSLDSRYVKAREGTRSEMVALLIAADKVIGAFNIESDRVNAFTEEHLELLMAFANQVALMIERARLNDELEEKRRIEEELKIARQIQASFLPSECPLIEGFDICGVNIPFEEVGGDYYDFIRIVENQMGVAIADVSGKGIPASLIMASFRASLRAEIRNNYAIRTIFRKTNALLYESTETGRFVTAFYGVLDTKNKVLTFSNAGHNPPILLRSGGGMELLSEGGTILGILPDSAYEERPISLGSGDVLALYTDGVVELWGLVNSEAEEEAACVAASNVA